MEIIDFIVQYSNPKDLIEIGGLVLLIAIIFAETGLFFGFFLPGDSLLFTAGIFCGSPFLDTSILVLLISLNIASIIGYLTSYYIGSKMSGYLLGRKDTFFFKRKYIVVSEAFYRKHGGLSIVLGRFFPVIRTFIPLVAGLSQVNLKRFMVYNVLGSLLWIGSLVLSGYFIGKNFPGIFEYLEWVIVGICVVSTLPVLIAFLKNKVIRKEMIKEQPNKISV